MYIHLLTMLLLFVPTVLNAVAIYETCSRQAAAGPIYHCPLGTHCARNSVLTVGNEETKFLSIKQGKQFNIELPIQPQVEQWTLEPLPKESIIEPIYQAPAKNDPALFIFTFLTKKAGRINIELRKFAVDLKPITAQKKVPQPQRSQQILEKKSIRIEVIPAASK